MTHTYWSKTPLFKDTNVLRTPIKNLDYCSNRCFKKSVPLRSRRLVGLGTYLPIWAFFAQSKFFHGLHFNGAGLQPLRLGGYSISIYRYLNCYQHLHTFRISPFEVSKDLKTAQLFVCMPSWSVSLLAQSSSFLLMEMKACICISGKLLCL